MFSDELSDGVVTIRPATTRDAPLLVEGRDEEFHRFLGDGDPEPRPVACIVVADQVVGWVDYDHDRPWLEDDEINVGYNVFADVRGKGYATRAVRLLMCHVATDTEWRVATLLIHPDNARSLALARRAGFERVEDLDGIPYWKQRVSSFIDDSPVEH
jgi:RimJ/RimL family protein N-acetyltransferase